MQHYNSASVCTALCSSPKVWFPSVTGKLSLFTRFALPSPLFPASNQQSVVCLYEFVLFVCFLVLFLIFHMWMKSYGICLFPSDLFHLASRSIPVVVNWKKVESCHLLWTNKSYFRLSHTGEWIAFSRKVSKGKW